MVEQDAKIVILTMFEEVYRIHDIIKTINPEGFLIKSDLTSSELASAFQAIQGNPPFYSGTINKVLIIIKQFTVMGPMIVYFRKIVFPLLGIFNN